MGIDNHFLRFLIQSSKNGVDFTHTATIGRQNWYRMSPQLLQATFKKEGVSLSTEQAQTLFAEDGIYTEALFRFLGATTVESLDYSNYENATHIVDMNLRISDQLHNKYTVVIDGGTLEHIFNFPQAITNCMNMVAIGGHFIGLSPANNFFGHGFYQFSAELFFRIFEPSNGFVAEKVLLVEDEAFGQGWFVVTDPVSARARVTLMSATPAYLYVLGRKLDARQPFSHPPYQSDYVAIWEGEDTALKRSSISKSKAANIRNFVKLLIPKKAKHWLRQTLFPGPRSHPDHYKAVR